VSSLGRDRSSCSSLCGPLSTTIFSILYSTPPDYLLFLDDQWFFLILNSDFIYLDRLLVASRVV
jgi:hypothetical protein